MDLRRPRLINLYMDTIDSISSHITGRSLLSESNTDDHDGDSHALEDVCSGHEGAHDIEEAFEHIYFAMLFMACLWFVGKACARMGLPALVGEIIVGIVLGPNFLDFVPYSDAMVVIGEIGLVLLVLEAGIDVSIGHLKVVGSRGLGVAVLGSILPLAIGTGLAMLRGLEVLESIAIGACLAPTSMGIALNVLRNAKVLNTPTGQLIIAAAVLDDVIALMLLSELEAMADPTIFKILMPLIVSPAFILFFGWAAIKWTPWLIQKIMMKTAKSQHENVILLLVFVSTFVMIPVCKYAGSSHLLGAFLAGLMFCTDHTIHEAWSNQIKRIMQWMLRIFFACTIGFAVPIQDFWSEPVLTGAMLYFVAILGKVATGIFARPMTLTGFLTISFSMSAWGEFAFILATASYGTGTMSHESYSSVLMAVLLSVIISPLCLRLNLTLAQKSKDAQMAGAREQHQDDDEGGKVSVYFCVHTKGRGKWGHQDKLLHCIFGLDLEIIDFRAFNEAEYNYSHHLPIVQDVFYVRDTTLSLPPTKRLGKKDEQTLNHRHREVRKELVKTMADPHAKVDVMRWIPGVRRNDDVQSPRKGGHEGNGGTHSTSKKKRKTASYCRKEAYRQARLALDSADAARSSGYLVSGISRIRPGHDALHRDRFTYHGGVHTEEDDLIALQFVNTLESLHKSLSPEMRRSPSESGDKDLNHEELLAKVQTLSNFVHHMNAFAPALSDDGRRELSKKLEEHDMPGLGTFRNLSVSSQGTGHTAGGLHTIGLHTNGAHTGMHTNGMHTNGHHHHHTAVHTNGHLSVPHTNGHGGEIHSFDAHYANTFNSLHPNISANSVEMTDGVTPMPAKRSSTAEHGSMRNLEHNHSVTMHHHSGDKGRGSIKDALSRPMPGLFASSSHGQLPSLSQVHHGHGTGKFKRDIFPRDQYAGLHHPGGSHHHSRLPSSTGSLDGHSALHHPSSDSESSSDSSSRIDTMYADEDRHHNPLYSALGDVNEDSQEEGGDDEVGGGEQVDPREEEEKPPEMKRSGTWSKLSTVFKHKKHSDDEETPEAGRSKTERVRRRKKMKKSKSGHQSSHHHHPESSSEDAHAASRGNAKGKMSQSMKELSSSHRAPRDGRTVPTDDDDDEYQPLKH